MFKSNIISLNIFVDCIMVLKENNWIGITRGDMIVQDPCYEKITMVMMFLGLISYIPAIL
jgi:hypothetical protein